jgi:hypothetical protein
LKKLKESVGKKLLKYLIEHNGRCYEKVCVAPAANLLIARVVPRFYLSYFHLLTIYFK